jgi:DNA repair protein RadA/Sms
MSQFVCGECGYESPKWIGKCPGCGVWNTFRETARITGSNKKHIHIAEATRPIPLTEIDGTPEDRRLIGIGELDGVLGGGLLTGMAVLIGGEPGIGKSTLMLQAAGKLAAAGANTLYVSGEESAQQVRMRSRRLETPSERVYLLCTTDAEQVRAALDEIQPALVVIDSIQSVAMPGIDNSPGSVTQLRECAGFFTRLAKQKGVPFFLIGHVTKDGVVAGPKIIEHMVDTVLYFEGETQYKILRAVKNRFGSTNEIGVFEMRSDGLQEVMNPTALFLDHGNRNAGIGCVIEGSRAFMVEAQSLVSPANYGTSQRVSLGYNQKKLAVMLAVIEKYLSINLRMNDVFLNIAGGMSVSDPGIDLAVAASLLSSFTGQSLDPETVWIGEIGLGGEVRPAAQMEKRVGEAFRQGFKTVYVPERSGLTQAGGRIMTVNRIDDFFGKAFGG